MHLRPTILLVITLLSQTDHTAARSGNVNRRAVNNYEPQIRINYFRPDDNDSNGGTLMENSAASTPVALITVTDRDSGPGGQVSCIIDNNMFHLQEMEGRQIYKLITSQSIDREATPRVSCVIMCRDNGVAPKVSTAQVKLRILDRNDNAPVFLLSDYRFNVVENSPAPMVVGRVRAVDPDSNENALVEYRIVDSQQHPLKYFSINRHSGTIHLNSSLDRERQEQFVFQVVAIDRPRGGEQPKTNTATVTVVVADVNDNRPRIVWPENNRLIHLESTTPIGRDLIYMRATDPDEGRNGRVSYRVLSGADGFFSIDKTAGVFYPMRRFNRVRGRVFSVVLEARDYGRPISLSSTVRIRIQIV